MWFDDLYIFEWRNGLVQYNIDLSCCYPVVLYLAQAPVVRVFSAALLNTLIALNVWSLLRPPPPPGVGAPPPPTISHFLSRFPETLTWTYPLPHVYFLLFDFAITAIGLLR